MNLFEILLSGLVSLVGVVIGISGKLLLGQIRAHHLEAMNHIGELATEIRGLRESIQQHLRDHATGAFHGGE